MPSRCPVWSAVTLLFVSGCAFVGAPGSNVRGCYPNPGSPPPAASEPPLTRFIAMGDFGSGESGNNRAVATAMERFVAAADPRPERAFELGDNFYDHGLLGADASCWDVPVPQQITAHALAVLQPFEFLRDRAIPLTAIPGNHDYGCSGRGLTNQFDIDRWLPAPHRWGDRWQLIAGPPQEVILGNGAVQVITLDSYRMIGEDRFRTESAARLEDLLRAGRDRYRWQVVATHHPLQTNGAHDGAWWKGTVPKLFSFLLFPSHALAAAQIPPFDFLNEGAYAVRYTYYRRAVEAAVQRSGASVAVVLAGHDHDLQLLAPSVTGGPFTLVSGSAARCTPVRARSDTLFASGQHGFAVVTAYASHLDVAFVGTSGCATRTTCGGAADGLPHVLFGHRIPRPAGRGLPAG